MKTCNFAYTGLVREDGWQEVVCQVCGTRLYINHEPQAVISQCRILVGTHLEKLISQIGIQPNAACSCVSLKSRMNAWEIQGCRDNREAILLELRANAAQYGWLGKITAARKAVETGIAWHVNWLDPLPGLLDLAIERAALAGPTARAAG